MTLVDVSFQKSIMEGVLVSMKECVVSDKYIYFNQFGCKYL